MSSTKVIYLNFSHPLDLFEKKCYNIVNKPIGWEDNKMTIKTFFINQEKTASVKAYLPDSIAGLQFCEKRPGVVIFPGGSYEFCSDREGEPIALQYLARGYAAFVVTYTCNARFPAALTDAAYTFYKIRMRAEEFHID